MVFPDEIQKRALKTWYAEDDPMHLDPLHPTIAIAGESGEILDQYKKHKWKDSVRITKEDFLEELGDLQFYVAIRLYQLGCDTSFPSGHEWSTLYTLSEMNYAAAILLRDITWSHYEINDLDNEEQIRILNRIASLLKARCKQGGTTWDYLSQLNREKLRGGKHGWPENGKE